MQSITRAKATILSVSTVAIVAVVAVVAFSAGVFSKPDNTNADATTSNSSTSSSALTDSALVVNAAEYYMTTQKSVAADTNQVYDLQVSGDNARGKYYNGDSSSVFYAHKANNRWSVVYSGQTTIPKATADQYNMPSSWADKTF